MFFFMGTIPLDHPVHLWTAENYLQLRKNLKVTKSIRYIGSLHHHHNVHSTSFCCKEGMIHEWSGKVFTLVIYCDTRRSKVMRSAPIICLTAQTDTYVVDYATAFKISTF